MKGAIAIYLLEVNEVVERSPKSWLTKLPLLAQQATELETDLQQYETQYQMPSPEFYQKFRAGELGDDLDFVEWNSF